MATRKEALMNLISEIDDDANTILIEHSQTECKWKMAYSYDYKVAKELSGGSAIHGWRFHHSYDPPRKPVPRGGWALAWDDDESKADALISTGKVESGQLRCCLDPPGGPVESTKLYSNWKHLVVKDD